MTRAQTLVGAMGLASWRARWTLGEYAAAATGGGALSSRSGRPHLNRSLNPLGLNEVGVTAVARIAQPRVRSRLRPLMEAGLVARCVIIDLEAGVSARSGPDWTRTRSARSPWPSAWIDQSVLDRAFEVQGELASLGLHRTVKIGDLLIAATAERSALVVLHYDHDFERIAGVTDQPVEWVLPPGAAD